MLHSCLTLLAQLQISTQLMLALLTGMWPQRATPDQQHAQGQVLLQRAYSPVDSVLSALSCHMEHRAHASLAAGTLAAAAGLARQAAGARAVSGQSSCRR